MSAKKESKEIEVKTENAVSIPTGSWGSEHVNSSDMIIPRIQLLQKTSKMVEKEVLNAKAGEFRESLGEKLLGGKNKPLSFIPIFITNTWIVLDAKGNKFVRNMARSAANEDLEYEQTIDGKTYRNIKSINVFCLLPEDIEKKEPFPFMISFQATSFQAGRKLITMVQKLKMLGKPLAAKNFTLSCEGRENEKGSWFVFNVEQGEDTKPTHLQAAYQWYKTVSEGDAQVHEVTQEITGAPAPVVDTGEF